MSFLMDGVTQVLNADPGVAAVLNSRLWPVTGPLDQPAYPYCSFRTVTGGEDDTFDGAICSHKTIQFDVFADTYADGPGVLQALRNVLSSLAGTLPDGTRVLGTHKGTEEENFDEAQRIVHSFVEYEFEYVET